MPADQREDAVFIIAERGDFSEDFFVEHSRIESGVAALPEEIEVLRGRHDEIAEVLACGKQVQEDGQRMRLAEQEGHDRQRAAHLAKHSLEIVECAICVGRGGHVLLYSGAERFQQIQGHSAIGDRNEIAMRGGRVFEADLLKPATGMLVVVQKSLQPSSFDGSLPYE